MKCEEKEQRREERMNLERREKRRSKASKKVERKGKEEIGMMEGDRMERRKEGRYI